MMSTGICMLTLAYIGFKVDVYQRVPAYVGVSCSFISQGKDCWWGVAKQADKIVKHSGGMQEHRQLLLGGKEEREGRKDAVVFSEKLQKCVDLASIKMLWLGVSEQLPFLLWDFF